MLLQYTAVPKGSGAPLRTVTVKDAIGDLPPLTNGANVEDMQYAGAPQTLPVSHQSLLHVWQTAWQLFKRNGGLAMLKIFGTRQGCINSKCNRSLQSPIYLVEEVLMKEFSHNTQTHERVRR